MGALVRAVAPLTRLLRGEVLDQLDIERRAITAGESEEQQPFLGLARDWRALLFPTATDAVFADGYAQTVTFALLLARTENIDLAGVSLHSVGQRLGHEHSLMGKALQLLTDDVAADFKVTLDLLVRVVGATRWDRIRKGKRDTYLQLYEHFLELYDPELRKKSGSYYTPREVVDQMVRLTEEALISRLSKPDGFADPTVLTVDPGMGTGTYLHSIIERIAERARTTDGPGSVPGAITAVAARLVGFEIQMGPYAVAELRTTDLVRDTGAKLPPHGMRLFVTDTLDDPHAAETQLGSGLKLIAEARRKANEVKARHFPCGQGCLAATQRLRRNQNGGKKHHRHPTHVGHCAGRHARRKCAAIARVRPIEEGGRPSHRLRQSAFRLSRARSRRLHPCNHSGHLVC